MAHPLRVSASEPGPSPQATGKTSAQVLAWKLSLAAHWRWWLHRRRLQWRQTVAAILVTAGTLMLWLFLVSEVLE